jgi:hypothetical protein
MNRRALAGLLLGGLVLVAGCTQTSVLARPGLGKPAAPPRVLVMPADIELGELTAGGLLEPRADWTEQARTHVREALRRELESRRAIVLEYERPAGEAEQTADDRLVKLHDAVGGAIVLHKYLPELQLPTKEGRFDWSLGAGVKVLRERTGADYALFVVLRDSYASPGRMALIVGAALLGVGIPGGRQVGFASLVDLGTGDIVWFNRLIDPAGDLRQADPARRAVKSLLAELPL